MKTKGTNHPTFNGFVGWWYGTVNGTLTPDEYESLKNKYKNLKNDETRDTKNQ